MIVHVYQRRVRTDASRTSPHTNRQYAPAYRWGYIDGKPTWIRVEHVEAISGVGLR